jgi:hypothetical protein
MGMFDSFIISLNEQKLELQTKQFGNVLAYYHPGDSVDGAVGGVEVYFDTVKLGADGKQVYRDEDAARTYTVFIVLVHTVFTRYFVEEGDQEQSVIVQRLADLKAEWHDTGKVLLCWLEFLRDAQDAKRLLQGCINDVESLISYARRLQAGEDTKFERRWNFGLHEERQRLDAGDDVLDVLALVLRSDTATNNEWQGRSVTRDMLDKYRL